MLELRNVSVAAGGAVGPGGSPAGGSPGGSVVGAAGGDQNQIEIISDVSLTLEKKKIYVITGPNGGGKTSLAKAIMGIFPVSGGSIFLDGVDVTNKSITERAALGIGYAFQAPTRFKGLKVRDFLTIAARGAASVSATPGGAASGAPTPGGASERDLYSLLVDVGLCAQDYIDRELNASFSGGELKRIEIASILARDLRVALFDEPEAGIDLWSFQRLTETFRSLNEMTDTTIVIISHQERILRLADEVILIAGGKVTERTTPDKILWDIECRNPDCECINCVEKEVAVC